MKLSMKPCWAVEAVHSPPSEKQALRAFKSRRLNSAIPASTAVCRHNRNTGHLTAGSKRYSPKSVCVETKVLPLSHREKAANVVFCLLCRYIILSTEPPRHWPILKDGRFQSGATKLVSGREEASQPRQPGLGPSAEIGHWRLWSCEMRRRVLPISPAHCSDVFFVKISQN